MKIVVTGGAGFIGSHVVDKYIELGHEVLVIDNLSTGKLENINPKAHFEKIDIQDPKILDIFKNFKPHIVNHHAAQASVIKSLDDPLYDAHVNILGTINLINSSIKTGVEKFIFISTGGALYGEPHYLPCDENHPLNPLSFYGTSKLACEKYLQTTYLIHNFPYIILRYGNVYGPRQDPFGEAGVIAIFTERMLNHKPVEIFGDGFQMRDFVHVSDVVESNVLALNYNPKPSLHLKDHSSKDFIFNVGTGKGTTVNEIFHILKNLTNYPYPPLYREKRPGEVYRIFLNIENIKEKLKYTPHISINDGLEKTLLWFMNQRKLS